ncbi:MULTISPECIES: aldo/keto reductase [Rhizobium]|uniref:Dehydrogenase/aryl-alcohol dehydrogenase-like putative oxidoreductase n=1 Tax=Rhizobium tropici TaxID=398 RepID=A0A6P1C9I4_RHITR|nr:MULTISPECIES: aldo/keto reductase [Rhizobium]AGB69508.1 putative oxidoreductase [Rhizobium tropici CIAT 899]MBB4244461.1 putative dehydrogenase/aryl-alcohol dehydrogenase-like putative oxidoreductase [Rhizobium tropici]MBB5595595.1 putative dehydrogenase/aryl-alcohol dehydrogenase-like putative oxidoreductase [Rhizobium tropici]MBB6494800.1 putative dehydrogenase/aryl-alcohol dehydrogenase-like putative oxidoreductase [Rhizobium tropici]NEV13131.1 Gfo/Idh/MocA family oxidoreductase [Rhizobi
MTTETPIRWGIIGPGRIAQTFADGIAHSRSGKLVAIASRNPDKPGLGDGFPGARIVNGYEALLADKEIDAIYIATPHTGHAEWAIKAIRAGKHVLVEKPIALSAFDAEAIYYEAKKAGVFAGEAFMYRVHPQTAKLIELVQSGVIGNLRIIRTSFGFNMGKVNPEHRLFANDMAGGGILDVGGYPVSMARLIAGAVDGKPFLDPEKVSGVGHLGQTGVDEWASAVLKFPNDIIAEVSCSIMANQDNTLRIIGSEGRIEVADFWFASGHKGGVGKINVIKGGETQTSEVKEDRWLYSFEVDAAGDAIRAGQKEFAYPGISWADSIGNLKVLDQWRASIGLEYGVEKAAKRTKNIAGATVTKGNSVPKRSIPGISKPASLVTLGFEFFPNFAAASLTLDAFYEAGGNAFDTAYVYGGGKTESIFGDWHTSRNVPREEIVLIGKGAHSPLCYPDVIAKQLDQSLNRLKTDYVDIYFMHRDNTDVPVGEFVDAMDAEVKAGRIRGILGGSNWTRARFDEAIAYAQKNGKTAPAALSNNFSLAEMLDPIWAGCVAASDDEWKTWLNAKQIPNFAWSSQGRGFFTDRAGRDKRDEEELVRVWYSDRNFGRRDRAIELAQKLGRNPIHIALAYVVAQPFPVIPLIGPRTIAELEDSLSALDIKLTPEQVKWLEG